jgi:cytochrome c5
MNGQQTRVMRLVVLGLILPVWAGPLAAAPPAVGAGPEPATQPSPAVMRQWASSCALCHVDGNGGAPRIGHPDEWQARVVQGRAILLEHTVNGLNNMPPLGYCMSCEAEDFQALIDFMAGAGQ